MGVGNIIIGSHKTTFCFAQSFRNVHTLRYGLKSGPMRRASSGKSPLLRLWLPSPEVAVKSLAVLGKSVHQSHRVVVTFVNRESDTPVPPHWYASRTPAKHREIDDVEQTKKMVPLITRKITLGENFSKLVLGVNIFDLELGIQVDSVKQPI